MGSEETKQTPHLRTLRLRVGCPLGRTVNRKQMTIQRPPRKKARIEIIPMIDVIFFLLVFFMMTSLSMVRMKGVSMVLPRGGAGQGNAGANAGNGGPSKLVVTVTPKGEFFVGRQKVGRENFKGTLEDAVKRRPDSVVILNVAKSQNAQSLIDVIDSVNTVASPSGQPLQILIATEPVDANGNVLKPAR